MKAVLWSGLFMVSFMGGHFIANRWLPPVGYILLFIKLYVFCLLGFGLLSQVIPYILALDPEKEEACLKTDRVDIDNSSST